MASRMQRRNTPVRSQHAPEQDAGAAPGRARRWTLYAFFGAEILVASLLLILNVPHLDGPIEVLLLLIALNVVAEMMPIQVYGDSYISVGFVLITAIMILFGLPGVAIAAPIEAIAGAAGRRRLDYRVVTNSAMFIIVYSAGAGVYSLLSDVNPQALTWEMIPAVFLAAIISFATNAVLLSTAGSFFTGQPVRVVWAKHRWIAPHYIAFGFIGLALALAHMTLGVVGILAFLTPAFMMRLAMKQYVDKTKENVEKLQRQNEALQRANIEVLRVSTDLRESYDDTLEALVNALDARDQETKGHSIRVSHYMMEIAQAMGVRDGTQVWADMQRGSLLHDVGKIGVTDAILRKPAKLTPEEWSKMRLHPEIGYNMLRQVKFLQGAAELILAHHERWDGQGYPRGLREEEIPLGARIFMVVDTFDSMTSDRPYRKALSTQEALDEILRYRGSQFDPTVVEAFLDIYDTWVKEHEELLRLTSLPSAG